MKKDTRTIKIKKTIAPRKLLKINLRKRRTMKRSRNRLGGQALASGGFGCIFKPALKCKGNQSRPDGVSKMSIEKHGKQEMLEIERIRNKLVKIKNYHKYYLLDVEMCKPDKLNDDDIKDFDNKCFALTRYNITEKNVNQRLDGLTILNMPDGGIDLHDWLIGDGKITKDRMILLNSLLAKLLKNGVRPMNTSGVIHNDLKDRNIMIDKDLNARIIDWGLAGLVSNNKIPEEIMNRPLQFNTPFSSMILSDDFKVSYDSFLQTVKEGRILFNRTNVRNYVINEYLVKLALYYKSNDDNVSIFNMIFSPGISDDTELTEVKTDGLIEYGYYLYYLSTYITDILMKYTNDSMEVDLDKYFMDVYLFNSDIFGLMTVYYNYFEVNIHNIDLQEDLTKTYLNRIRSLLAEHIYSNGGEKINVNKLLVDIKSLNNVIANNGVSRQAVKRRYSISRDINKYTSPIVGQTRTKINMGTRSRSTTISRRKSVSK